MSKSCNICQKSSQKGKKIALIWGVKYRSIRHRQPNLRKTVVEVDGIPVNVQICTTCLKTIKNDKMKGVKYPNYTKQESVTPETENIKQATN